MQKKFIVPATTMILGLLTWVAFLITRAKVPGLPAGIGAVLCLVAGGLIVFSAFRCRKVNGPRGGNIFRSALLAVLAGVTFWRAGMVEGAFLTLGAAAVLALVFMRPCSVKTAGDKA
jgi:hypothetical protein